MENSISPQTNPGGAKMPPGWLARSAIWTNFEKAVFWSSEQKNTI